MIDRKFFECGFILIFVFFLIVIGMLTFVKEKESVSIYENRFLASTPVATAVTVADGSYFSAWETYFTDHAAGRKTLLRSAVVLDKDVFHRPVINDVVVTEDRLLPYLSFQNPKEDVFRFNSDAVTDAYAEVADITKSYGGEFLLVLIPSTYDYFADEYPSYLNNRTAYTDMTRAIFFSDLNERDISYLDIGEKWENQGYPDHYMSAVDHHFTWDWAWSVFTETMAELDRMYDGDLLLYDENDFAVTELSNPYLGSYLRRLWGLWDGGEHMSYGELKYPLSFVRTEEGVVVSSYLHCKVANSTCHVDYTHYMGGDMTEVVIDTSRPELPDILIFGDSFTNAEETLLYASFDTMTSLDFRYYDKMTLTEYVKTYQPDIVIGFRDYETMANPAGNGLCYKE